jgi:hypothetical protein
MFVDADVSEKHVSIFQDWKIETVCFSETSESTNISARGQNPKIKKKNTIKIAVRTLNLRFQFGQITS